MTSLKYPPVWLTWVVAGANLLAIADLPYGYYQLLRLVVTGYAAYIAYLYFRRGLSAWGWAFGFIALLYNPLFVISMSKAFHALVNLAVAGAAVVELKIARRIGGESDRSDPAVEDRVSAMHVRPRIQPAAEEHVPPHFFRRVLKLVGVLALMAIGAAIALNIQSDTSSTGSAANDAMTNEIDFVTNEASSNGSLAYEQPFSQVLPTVTDPAFEENEDRRSIYEIAEDPFHQGVTNDGSAESGDNAVE